MAEFPALPLWTDALIGDTHHLTTAQFGAYMRLLICAWRRENCDLPSNDQFLGRVIGDTKNWHRMKPFVMPFFTLGDDGLYRQKRLLRERDYVSRQAAKSSAGGRAKALKMLNQRSAYGLPNACLTPAPTPTPKKEDTDLFGTTSESVSERILPTAKNALAKKTASALLAIPDWVPKDAWDGFVAMRKAMPKAPLTPYAIKLAITTLEKLKAAGEDPASVLDQSTLLGWRGLFPVRPDATNGAGSNAPRKSRIRTLKDIEESRLAREKEDGS